MEECLDYLEKATYETEYLDYLQKGSVGNKVSRIILKKRCKKQKSLDYLEKTVLKTNIINLLGKEVNKSIYKLS